MHARGEYNEKKAECQAIQRNYRAAILLGVPADIAKENAVDFYESIYPKHSYFLGSVYQSQIGMKVCMTLLGIVRTDKYPLATFPRDTSYGNHYKGLQS